MKVKKDIKIVEGIIIKKGADVHMNEFGEVIINRNGSEYVWTHDTDRILNEVRIQNGLEPIENDMGDYIGEIERLIDGLDDE